MKALLERLGLPEHASEEAALAALETTIGNITSAARAGADARVGQLMQPFEMLLSVCSVSTPDELIARVDELTAEARRTRAAESEVAALKSAAAAAEIKALLDQASIDGRLTPAKRKEIESGADPTLTTIAQEPAKLRAWLGLLPVLPFARRHSEPAAITTDPNDPTEGGKRSWADLTGQEKADLYVTNRGLYEELKKTSRP